MSVEEYNEPHRLSKEEEESLIKRLYDDSIELKQRRLEELDRRYYPVAQPRSISEEELKKSVERQVDQEMALRRTRREEAEAATLKASQPAADRQGSAAERRPSRANAAGPTMSSEEVEESVKRMYNETLARKQANLEESKRRYAPAKPSSKKVPKTELQEWVEAASKPKKTEFSIEEINKIYGF